MGNITTKKTPSIRTICTQNNYEKLASVNCRTECAKESNKSWCDVAAVQYCTTTADPDRNYCGCINSPNATAEDGPGPISVCFDPLCNPDTGSYVTQATTNTIDSCAKGNITFTQCKQIIDCRDSGVCQINNVEFTSKCGNILDGKQPVPSPGVPPTTKDTNNTDSFFTTTNIIIIIIVIVIVIILIIVIFVVIYNDTG